MSKDNAIYEKLKEVANKKQIIYYSEIAHLARLDMSIPHDRERLGAILDEINREELKQGHPMLSAIVVQKNTNLPGQGFFTLAQSLDLFVGSDKDKFYIKELKKVHDYWSETSK